MTLESVWHIPFNVCTALKNGTKYKEKQKYNLDTRREGIVFSILTSQLLAIIENKENDSYANK